MVSIQVTDGRGSLGADTFFINVVDNGAPAVARANPDQLVGIGASLNYDPTQGGDAFRDVDGDAISYEVTIVSAPHGLSVNGTRVLGVFDSVGLTRIRVRASDGFGGVGEDLFSIAASAPEPPRPNLPLTQNVYDDFELSLPYLFRISREGQIPFFDTTPPDNPTTNAGAALGRVLFYDKRLSITNTVACASCHEHAKGFARPERFSVGAQGMPLRRNSMALANVRYNNGGGFFGDARVVGLENLVAIPIEEAMELGIPMDMLEVKLAATDFYPPLFAAAFGTPEVTRDRISKAVAQFLRSMLSYRSKFDRAHHGMEAGIVPEPATVFTAQEMRGEEIFVASRCGHCHSNSGSHNGVHPQNNGLDVVFSDADAGAGFGRFRPASLRNIAVTAPYMHDGRFATVRDVIEHYDHGIQDGPHLEALLRTNLQDDPLRLNLSEEDKDALEAFLNTLTDEEFLTDPKFSDPFQ